MFARLLLIVIPITLAFSVAGSARGDDADAIRKATALLEAKMWKVAKVVPSADGLSGSILVTRRKDELSTESMWIGLGEKTPFSLNDRSEGVRVADIQEGMSVMFEHSGETKSLPPKAVGVTAVYVFGKGSPGSSAIRELLDRRNDGIAKPK